MIDGCFPEELKLGCITPIFKKGDKDSIENYRPVCSLSPFSKIIERIIYDRMITFINKNNIFSNTQFGFRKGMHPGREGQTGWPEDSQRFYF